MKIERDKWYVMRNGEKVRVVCVDAPGYLPVVAVDEIGDAYWASKSGRACGDDSPYDDPHDLISEYREPARVWVNFYEDGQPVSFASREAAIRAKQFVAWMPTRIAVEFVEVVRNNTDSEVVNGRVE